MAYLSRTYSIRNSRSRRAVQPILKVRDVRWPRVTFPVGEYFQPRTARRVGRSKQRLELSTNLALVTDPFAGIKIIGNRPVARINGRWWIAGDNVDWLFLAASFRLVGYGRGDGLDRWAGLAKLRVTGGDNT